MALTDAQKRIIEERYTTRDQKILAPNIFIKDFPLEPPGLFLKTNNFVQQGLNRLLGYYPTDEKWLRVTCGSDGGLLLSQDSDTPGAVRIQDREAMDVKLLDSVAVPATSLVTHVGEDISDFSAVTIQTSSTGNVTIYFQTSNDNVNWYDVKTTPDTDLSFNCSAEKTSIYLIPSAHYFRVVIYATTASTVTVELHARV